MPLKEWWEGKSDGEKCGYLLPKDFNTDIAVFDDFYCGRRKWLGSILAEKLDAKESEYRNGEKETINVWSPRFESDEELDELKKRHDAIIQKYREHPTGDLEHFVRQCVTSAKLEEGGLKED